MNCAVIREMLVSVAEPPSDPESCGAGVRVAVSWWAVWSKEGLLGGGDPQAKVSLRVIPVFLEGAASCGCHTASLVEWPWGLGSACAGG